MLTIGTALRPGATRVMLLGAGELGKEVAIECQRLGLEVIAVDRYADAPAMHVAHRSHVINMLDGAALKQLVAQEKPHYIVPEIEAIATDMLVELEKMGQHCCALCRSHPSDHEPRGHPPSGRRDVAITHVQLPLCRHR